MACTLAGVKVSTVPLLNAASSVPCRKVALGTVAVAGVELASIRRSQFAKRNNRSFLIGPPRDAPNWLRTSGDRGIPAWLLKKSFAASSVFRLYSYRDPW